MQPVFGTSIEPCPLWLQREEGVFERERRSGALHNLILRLMHRKGRDLPRTGDQPESRTVRARTMLLNSELAVKEKINKTKSDRSDI